MTERLQFGFLTSLQQLVLQASAVDQAPVLARHFVAVMQLAMILVMAATLANAIPDLLVMESLALVLESIL